MAIYTRSEICKLLNISQAYIASNVKRGNLILTDGKINDNLPENKLFIGKRINSNNNSRKTNDIDEEDDAEDLIKVQGSSELLKLKILRDKIWIKKMNEEYEKVKLQNSKLRGEVVPSELIKPVFLQHNQSIITEFKNATDEIIRIFSKKRSLTVEEVAEIKGETTETINNAINKATFSTLKAVENIVSEHQDKKSVGEHG